MFDYWFPVYTRLFIQSLPYYIVAIVGLRQIRRRWLKNPEANALICWGIGLLVASSLASISKLSFIYSMNDRKSQDLLLQVYSLLSLFVDAFALWLLIRGAMYLFNAPEEKPKRLNPSQGRVLLPLSRFQRGLLGSEQLQITEREILFTRETRGGTQTRETRRFELDPLKNETPPDLKVIIEQVGLVGPSRLLRRFRFVTRDSRKDFKVPVAEYSHVRDVLERLLPGQVVERDLPRRSLLDWILLIATIAFVLINLEFDLNVSHRICGIDLRRLGRDPDSPLFLPMAAVGYLRQLGPLAVLVLSLGLGWMALISRNRPPLEPVKAPKKPRRSRPPFHSNLLGWIVRIGSLVFTIYWLGSPSLTRWSNERRDDTPAAVYTMLGILSVATMTLGHRLSQRVFIPNSHKDPRAPFLFLRAFSDDDRKTLQPNGWLATLFGIPPDFGRRANGRSLLRMGTQFHPIRWFRMFLGLPADTVEELLAIGVEKSGPLVAIGQPGETVATSGAHRMYVPDDAWQSVVREYLAKSAGVILQPASTDGVVWEIRRTFESVPRSKVLLSLVNYQNRPQEYERFWLLLREEFGIELPRDVPFLRQPSFVYFDAQAVPYLQPVIENPVYLWPLSGNAVDIKRTLRAYLSTLESSVAREPARVRRSSPGQVIASLVLSILMVLLIAFGLKELSMFVYSCL